MDWRIFIMKIAVTYDNGNVFQHFGKTENFKVYEVEDNKVVSSEVIGSNGTGHGALAGLLAEQGIDVLICGGIGGGAQTALAEAGIQLCSGAQGNTDEVVEAYLKGELESAGTTCDHHHEEGHSCGNHEEGESCGSSCGGCGSHKPAFSGPNVGKTCRTHYKGTFNDGTQFDSSYDRGQPLEFVCGAGQMIKGFDAAVADMKVGEIKEIHLMPEEAYGQQSIPAASAIFCASTQYADIQELCLYGPALMIRISVLPSAFIFSASSSVILFCSNLSFLYCAESCMSSCMVCSTSVFSYCSARCFISSAVPLSGGQAGFTL